MPDSLRPVSLSKDGEDRLAIQWSDGHRGVYAWRHLRAQCPCASCREERTKPPDPFRILSDKDLARVPDTEPVLKQVLERTLHVANDARLVERSEHIIVVIGTPVDEHLNPNQMAINRALGGCAEMVICRAIVRDRFDDKQSAKAFSALVLVMGVAPILAPWLGGQLAEPAKPVLPESAKEVPVRPIKAMSERLYP